MSIKLYNGYKIPKMSLDEMMVFINQFREKAKKLRNEMLLKQHVNMITEILDRHVLERGFPTKLESPVSNIMSAVRWHINTKCREIYKTGLRNIEYDYGFSMCLFPMEEKILVQIFGDKKEYDELWEAEEIVEEYHYQTSTDMSNLGPGENINNLSDERRDECEKDWNRRHDDWEEAFNFGVPSEHGLEVMIISENHMPWLKEEYELLIENVFFCMYIS